MKNLNAGQIKDIRNILFHKGVIFCEIQEELIDHIASEIEEKMAMESLSFEASSTPFSTLFLMKTLSCAVLSGLGVVWGGRKAILERLVEQSDFGFIFGSMLIAKRVPKGRHLGR